MSKSANKFSLPIEAATTLWGARPLPVLAARLNLAPSHAGRALQHGPADLNQLKHWSQQLDTTPDQLLDTLLVNTRRIHARMVGQHATRWLNCRIALTPAQPAMYYTELFAWESPRGWQVGRWIDRPRFESVYPVLLTIPEPAPPNHHQIRLALLSRDSALHRWLAGNLDATHFPLQQIASLADLTQQPDALLIDASEPDAATLHWQSQHPSSCLIMLDNALEHQRDDLQLHYHCHRQPSAVLLLLGELFALDLD